MGAYIEIENKVNLKKYDREFKIRVNEVVSALMIKARQKAVGEVRSYLSNSPREAERAVRNIVYRKVLGGNLNIYNVRRALRNGPVPPISHYPSGRVRPRLRKTTDMYSYHGVDRGFILRFNTLGSYERTSAYMDGSPIDMAKRQRIRSKRIYHNKSKGETYKSQIIGYRGRLKAKNLFEQPATNALLGVKDEFEMLVYKIISDMQL